MSGLTFSEMPPSHWDDACERTSSLFHARDWLELLERSFDCRSFYAWNADHAAGAALSVFKAGPFRVAYCGFPVGGTIGNPPANDERLLDWHDGDSAGMVSCIRIPVSAFREPVDLPFEFETNPETAIADLQNWDLARTSQNVRRNLRKAEQSGLELFEPADASDGKELNRIYRETIERHGGSLRYNERYFSELISLAKRLSKLRILVAKHEGDFAGFIVVGMHQGTAYYLHGGTDATCRQLNPATLLFNESIRRAREDGCDCFNLMSSPNDQPSLVKFKEKWGGETRQHKTYTLPLRSSYRVFKVAEYIYRWLR